MYSTCLFCNSSLGRNNAVDQFPVGRRLAFDSAAGRLWVVCAKCERWNLSPLEIRWEAIEEAERLFRGTKLRVSSDNIGMAQLRDGTELVRIGRPVRTEFAAWRYGDQFGRRWRKYVVGTAAVAAGARAQAALQVVNVANIINLLVLHHGSNAGLAIAGASAVSIAAVGSGFHLIRRQRSRKHVATVRNSSGDLLRLNQFGMDRSVVTAPNGTQGWNLCLMHPRIIRPGSIEWRLQADPVKRQKMTDVAATTYVDGDALRVLNTILPHVNRGGGSKRNVNDAVEVITEARELRDILNNAPVRKPSRNIFAVRAPETLSTIPAPIRLALEMALHESDERRAMEGELKELEQRWRDADTIAKIADAMFLPAAVHETLRELKSGYGDTRSDV